jgi:ElaB/YqjD/DUF883 family membrane-anchored ribosome-binding protein
MADIAETRAHMDDTIDELTERLQPRHLLDDVLDYFRSRRRSSSGRSGEGRQRMRRTASKAAGQVKEKAGNAGRAAYSQVRQHPLPALLIGAGISLLLMERNREESDYEEYEGDGTFTGEMETSYAEIEATEAGAPENYALPEHYSGQSQAGAPGIMNKLKEKGSGLKQKAASGISNLKERTTEKAGALRSRASEKTAELRERTAERTRYLKERAREKAHYGYEHSREAFTRSVESQPLAVGLGFLAVGVLAGMLIPSTRKEDELVGATRDRLVNRTREAAQDAVNRGKHVAQTAVEVAKQEAREQGFTPETLKEKAQAMASHVTEAARQDAQRQQQEFTEQAKQS